MAGLTFQVLEGVDKGRIFRNLSTPITIGREEGNVVRLNDERVSRFHAKVQRDSEDIILTDLESTNGTRVNGLIIQIRRLRPGDRVGVGRSLLLYGSNEEIAARIARLTGDNLKSLLGQTVGSGSLVDPASSATVRGNMLKALPPMADEHPLRLDPNDDLTQVDGEWYLGQQPLPPLPNKLTPSQAARLAEILDFLHQGITSATEHIRTNEESALIILSFADWQQILAVQMLLARYLRGIADPDTMNE
ncbi:MAG: FHA domain-containing protein [Gemmataceae bacterium]